MKIILKKLDEIIKLLKKYNKVSKRTYIVPIPKRYKRVDTYGEWKTGK